jgi:NarL family two-component system sensor histidine kinase YdfH
MVIHYLLHATALTDRWPPWLQWAYFPIQAVLLIVIGWDHLDAGLVIGLALALCAEAPILITRPRPVMAAIACCLAGLAASLAWHVPATVVWNTTDYLSLVMFVIGGTLLLVLQRRANAQQRRLNAELTAAATRIQELTRETERRRIARDLHDTLSQGLVGVTMQLQAGIAHLEGGHTQRALPIFNGAVEQARATLGQARAAIHDLRSNAIPQDDHADPDLRQVLQAAVDRFGPLLTCAMELHIDQAQDGSSRTTPILASQLPLVARVVDEALTNVARHAQAGHIDVTAREDIGCVIVEVRDDGIGFCPGLPGEAKGYGLLGMAERARLAGCDLDIETAPGHGTLIRLRIPSCPGSAEPRAPAGYSGARP